MRPIDADVLKQHIDKLPALPDGNFAGNHSALKALINMQPTIEPIAQPEPHCNLGNPCIGCADYDMWNDTCRSEGACGVPNKKCIGE